MSESQLDESRPRKSLAYKQIVEWVVVVGVALVVAVFLRIFLLQQYYIAGPSMETTMFSDNRVLVNKLAYRLGEIERGDVVVFDRALMNGSEVEHDDLIKRVVGLAGETISIKDCVVLINGEALPEPYLPKRDSILSELDERCGVVEMSETKLAMDEVFLMGDNRPQSFDSRMFGAINQNLIIGQAFILIWPISSAKGL